jgi:hypothetical protein
MTIRPTRIRASLLFLVKVSITSVLFVGAVEMTRLQSALNAQRVHVRYVSTLSDADRTSFEQQFGLSLGVEQQPRTWSYILQRGSQRNIPALVSHAFVEDTHHIDRARFRVVLDRQDLPTFVRQSVESGWSPWISGLLALGGVLGIWVVRRDLLETARSAFAGIGRLIEVADSRVAGMDQSTISQVWALPISVVLLVLLVSGASAFLWRAYYANQPLWVEHAGYGMWANLEFLDSVASQGYVSALRRALGTRHILQPALLGFISPALLSSPHAHLLVVTGTLAVFLSLLTKFVRRRTGSLALAIATAVIFCSLSGLYDERDGIGVPWPDYQSMFLLGSAVLSLGLYALSGRVGQLAWAGAFASLSVLARDVAGLYAGLTCVPIVIFLLARDLRNGRPWAQVLGRGAVCGLTALPGMWLLALKLDWLRAYYMTSNVSQLRQALAVTTSSVWELFSRFTGFLPLAGLALLVLGGLLLWPRRRWAAADIVVAYWPASFLLLLVANGYTSDVTKEVMYMAPGLVCVAVTLGGGLEMRSGRARALVASVMMVSALCAGERMIRAYDSASHPGAGAAALRASQQAVGAALTSIPQTVTWHSYTPYDWGTVISVLTHYEFGHRQPTENLWFHNAKHYWDARFPGMTLPELREHIFNQADARVDVAIVLKDPGTKPEDMEDYSYAIARHVAERIAASPNWRHYRDVDTLSYGPLSLYINLRRTGSSLAGTRRRAHAASAQR